VFLLNRIIPETMKPTFERTAHPFYMWEELVSTPDVLRTVLQSDLMEHVKKAATALKDVKSIHLHGCGTSYFSSIAATYFFNQIAGIPAQAHNSFEFSAYPPAGLSESAVIAISHTGGTGVALDAIDIAEKEGAITIGLTDVEDSALASKATYVLHGGGTREKPLPKTRSYVSSLLKVYLLAVEVANQKGRKSQTDFLHYFHESPNTVQSVLDRNLELTKEIVHSLNKQSQIFLFGAGPNLATVMEGTLKLQETAQAMAHSFELEEGMHGPWVTMNADDLVIVYVPKGPSFEKAIRFVKAIQSVGVKIWALTDHHGEIEGTDYVTVLPDVPEVISPLYGTLPIYQFAYELSLSRGIRPDVMRLTDDRYLDARLKLPR
jgi:glucosamine--fructose-6-phosphate aminotransferase (isomerizing)